MRLDIEKVRLSSQDIKRIYFEAFPKKREDAFFPDGFNVEAVEYAVLGLL